MGKDILRGLKEAAMSRDEERLQFRTQQFTEHIGDNDKDWKMAANCIQSLPQDSSTAQMTLPQFRCIPCSLSLLQASKAAGLM